MILFVTLETDALGTVSRDHYSVSPDAVDRGIYVNALSRRVMAILSRLSVYRP